MDGRIPRRALEFRMQGKVPTGQPAITLFSLVLEHIENSGKSGQDTEKERGDRGEGGRCGGGGGDDNVNIWME
jgi:hypothetical protein